MIGALDMEQQRLISSALTEVVAQKIIDRLPSVRHNLRFEFQDDFQFLLVSIPYDPASTFTSEERKQLGQEIDRLMPSREGELTWMINFVQDGKVIDSYFGGDSLSPELGL